MSASTRLRELGARIVDNLGYKLVALSLSLILFAVTRGSGDVQRSVDVPLAAALPPAERGNDVLLTPLPEKVRVTVRGAASAVGSLRGDDVGPVQLDLREGHRRSVRFERSMLRMPAGANIVSFTPPILELEWDTLASRVLPIRPTVLGAPAARSRIERLEVEPRQVRVRGPTQALELLDGVHTEAVDVTGLGPGRYERRVALESLREGLSLGVNTPARVSFEVVPEVQRRVFERLAVTAIGMPNVSLRPPVVDVVVRGAPAVVEALLPSQVVPFVPALEGGVPRAPEHAAVQVRPLPEGVTAVEVSPHEVLVVPAHTAR